MALTKVIGNFVTTVPTGSVSASNLQAAITELDSEKAGKATANTFTAVQTPLVGSTSISTTSTFTYNPATHGQVCTVTLTGAITVTLAVASGSVVAGTPYTIIFKAGDTASRSFAKGATWLAPAGTLPITAGATVTNSVDVFHLIATDSNTVLVTGSTKDGR